MKEIQSNSCAVQSKGIFLWIIAGRILCKTCFFPCTCRRCVHSDHTGAGAVKCRCVASLGQRGGMHLDSPSHGNPGSTDPAQLHDLWCKSRRREHSGAGRAPGGTKAVLLKSQPHTARGTATNLSSDLHKHQLSGLNARLQNPLETPFTHLNYFNRLTITFQY